MTIFIDTSSNRHPYECNGPGNCIHCDRIPNPGHDPETCELCKPIEVPNPPLPLSKSVIVLPEHKRIDVNEDGTIEGATALRHCRDPIHVFKKVPGRCQCGAQYWGKVNEM